MFTGIVEEMARVVQLEKHQNNITLTLTTALAPSFNVDQSVSHNGCCLTVVHINPSSAEYQVTAIHETIVKTNLADWKVGDLVNLERSMQHNGRLDGHIVQGHVDTVGICNAIEDQAGSWKFTFTYEGDQLGQGKENARAFLIDNPDLANDIETKIRASYVPTEVDPALVAAVDEATADVEF